MFIKASDHNQEDQWQAHLEYIAGEQGLQAFLLDHTVGQGTTAVGTVAAIVHLAGGGSSLKVGLGKPIPWELSCSTCGRFY